MEEEGLHLDMSVQVAELEKILKRQVDNFNDRSSICEQLVQEYLKEKNRLESEISSMKQVMLPVVLNPLSIVY